MICLGLRTFDSEDTSIFHSIQFLYNFCGVDQILTHFRMESSSAPVTSTVAAGTPFKTLTSLFESIKNVSGQSQRDRRRLLIQSYLETWRRNYEKVHGGLPSSNGPESFFPFLRLLLPKWDERTSFSVQEFTLSKLFRSVLNIGADSSTSRKLTAWRRHLSKRNNVEDYGDVAAEALDRHLTQPKDGELSVEDVNNCLNALADANLLVGLLRKEKCQSAFLFLLRRMDKHELKWLIRILLKDLRLGLSSEMILDAFHNNARELFASHAKLSIVCRKLCDNKIRIQEYGLELMAPLLPMRAELWNFDKISAVLKVSSLVAEIKYDGERFQIHKDGKRFRFFSRPGNDYTRVFGETASEGSLLQYIAHCFRPDADSFIIDGELCPYYPKTRCLGSKADINWIQKINSSSGCQLCFVAFDLLYLNGEVLMNRSLSDRTQMLTTLFIAEEGRLMHATRREFAVFEHCMDFLNEIANTEEGLIIKDPRSVYRPKIQSPDWWKLKPEFIGNLCEQLDLVIMGVYKGHGESVSRSFLLGVVESNGIVEPKRILSICTVSVGFTQSELESIILKLTPHLRPWDPLSRPDYMILGKGEACRPSFWVEPSESCIIQVRAAQLILSGAFAAGFTLRFPRAIQIRSDKTWTEATSLSDIHRIDRERNRRLGAETVTIKDLKPAPSRSLTQRRSLQIMRLPTHELFLVHKDLSIRSRLFAGKEFCVVNGNEDEHKERIERVIMENGGTCTLHRSNRTFCIVSTKVCTKVRNIIKSAPVDVVRPAWIFRCVETEVLLPWRPDDLLYSKPQTSAAVKRSYDNFEDSFTEDVDADGIEKLFSKMRDKIMTESANRNELDTFLVDRFCTSSCAPALTLFRGWSFLVLIESPSPMLEVVTASVKQFGGVIKANFAELPSHIVLQPDISVDHLNALVKGNSAQQSKSRIVTWKWVVDCTDQCRLLDEREYYPSFKSGKLIHPVISLFDCFCGPIGPTIP